MKKIIGLVVFLTLFFWTNCKTETYSNGAELYKSQCANCHQPNGEGLGELIPPVAKSDYLKTHRDDLACVLRHGLKGDIVVNGKAYSDQVMLGNDRLKPADIANILNFLFTNFGNNEPSITIQDIEKQLEKCKTNQ